MQFWCTSGETRVERQTRKGQFDKASVCLHVGGNMMTSCQLLLRNEESGFEITGVEIAGDLSGFDAEIFYQEYIFYADGVPYPDRLCPADHPLAVRPNYTQGVFVTLFADGAAVGTRALTVTVHTTLGDQIATAVVTVHKATLPAPKDGALQHEYWTSFFANLANKKATTPEATTPFYDFDPYTPEWWHLMERYCHFFKRMRINTVPVKLGDFIRNADSRRISETEWKLDFSRMDEVVEFLLEHASIKRLTVGGIVEPLHRRTVLVLNEEGDFTPHDLFDDPTSERWLRTLYTALYEHFKEKGWLSYLCMHLQDEPHQTDTWLYARRLCRECMPGVPVSEPMDFPGIGPGLGEECDILIPRFDIYEADRTYYASLPKNGKELWCYSCCFPQEPWWLNKFLDLPHHYSALIYWACFSQDLAGYLHWGFNCWESGDRLFSGEEAQFKGDPFIVWPDTERCSLMPTLRAVASAQGTQDYELLHQLAVTDPDTAKQISRSVAQAFDRFNADPDALETARAEVLTLLDARLS